MTFTFENDDLTIRSAVFQALGAASMCWEHVGAAGEFDSDQAVEIGEALITYIREAIQKGQEI